MSFNIAQISDSHLFSQLDGKHCGVNVYENLVNVVDALSSLDSLDAIIFTGDLTQDHTEISYQHFAKLFADCSFKCPIYFLAGNHDDSELLEQHLVGGSFNPAKVISTDYWQVVLVNSKSDTPAGYLSEATFSDISYAQEKDKNLWIFMHHHPIDVGYFIDRHGLVNQADAKQAFNMIPHLKGIASGHVHRGLTLKKEQTGYCCDVLTCPATSIQFDPEVDGVSALPKGPGYRLIQLMDDGSYQTELHYLPYTS